MTEQTPATDTLAFASGATREVPATFASHGAFTVKGLDAEGRIVVDYGFDHYFGLTLCCNASDKGVADGVVCRACYGTASNADEGSYLFGRDEEIADVALTGPGVADRAEQESCA